ncbi:MAG: cytochrome c [Candidatus Hydrogenedentes bacterium]|nr:cytochrome c [Candidatus Hydrogenedentota bacterium]
MRRIPSAIWALSLLGSAYLFFRFGIAPLTERLTGIHAPLPSSLVNMYTAMVTIAILVFLSVTDERWNNFYRPVANFLSPSTPHSALQNLSRAALLTAIPLFFGWNAYRGETAEPDPPADPPGIHFSLPGKYVSVQNPLPWTEQNIREGGILYTRNCAMCHGDLQDGNGLFARAWQPKPANFRDTGTIAQLAENYLFWRIKEGGPGTPKGGIDYRSAMPAWGPVLSDNEIWKIIMFEYTNAGQQPARRDLL